MTLLSEDDSASGDDSSEDPQDEKDPGGIDPDVPEAPDSSDKNITLKSLISIYKRLSFSVKKLAFFHAFNHSCS